MVMKISSWHHKLSSKVSAMSQYTPDMFVKSQWQRRAGISVYYLVYRWVMAFIFLGILLASMLEVGRPNSGFAHYAKWCIYLTHWGFTVCTLQSLLAAYLVTRAHCQQPDKEVEAMKMNRILRIYWVLHNCATVGAFAITTIYWLFVYNPVENKLDALNLLVHVGNSVLMFTDLIVVSHPFRLIDFYWPMSFSIIYVIFTYFYFVSGGTDRKGRMYIYKILDWQKPGKSLVIAHMSILFGLVMHISVCLFCFLRCKLLERWRRQQACISEERTKNFQGATNEIPIDDYI